MARGTGITTDALRNVIGLARNGKDMTYVVQSSRYYYVDLAQRLCAEASAKTQYHESGARLSVDRGSITFLIADERDPFHDHRLRGLNRDNIWFDHAVERRPPEEVIDNG